MNYGVWNNKGGVGKTFLSFILGSEYAHAHSDSHVILVDMCPQSNLSEIVLGGNGTGATNLEEILSKGKDRKSVGGYIDSRIASPHTITGDETSYLISAAKYNDQLPENMWLICGDPSLEIQAQVISQIGSQTLPVDSWKNVHTWLKDLIQACKRKLGDNVLVFIDCNPSFSAYTGLSMIASDRLLIPCSSDGSSARAIDNVAALLFGHEVPDGYKTVNFAKKAADFGLPLPIIHSVILNRSTQYSSKASKAFSAMFDAIKRKVNSFKAKHPERFVSGDVKFNDMPDSHSVSIVCSHKGKPLYSVSPGKYTVHDTTPQVNPEPLNRYKDSVSNLVSLL